VGYGKWEFSGPGLRGRGVVQFVPRQLRDGTASDGASRSCGSWRGSSGTGRGIATGWCSERMGRCTCRICTRRGEGREKRAGNALGATVAAPRPNLQLSVSDASPRMSSAKRRNAPDVCDNSSRREKPSHTEQWKVERRKENQPPRRLARALTTFPGHYSGLLPTIPSLRIADNSSENIALCVARDIPRTHLPSSANVA